jgi:DNA repair exonuclease SbcCD ATPase subunit
MAAAMTGSLNNIRDYQDRLCYFGFSQEVGVADGEQITVPVPISHTQIERAVEAAVRAKAQDLLAEFSRSLALKSDEFRAQNQALLDRVEAGRDRVDAKIKEVDESLEALQGKVNTRVNTYVIPAVVVTFVAIVLAIFTAVGGFGVISNINHLKDQVEGANRTYGEVSEQLATLKLKLAAAMAIADADRIAQLQRDLKETQDRLDAFEKKNGPAAQGGKTVQPTPPKKP